MVDSGSSKLSDAPAGAARIGCAHKSKNHKLVATIFLRDIWKRPKKMGSQLMTAGVGNFLLPPRRGSDLHEV